MKTILTWLIILYAESSQTDESVLQRVYGSLISGHSSFELRFVKKEKVGHHKPDSVCLVSLTYALSALPQLK